MNNYFTVLGLDVYYYGVLIAASILIGLFLVRFLFKHKNIEKDSVFDLALIVLPVSIICARLYYVLFSGVSYSFAEFWRIWEGGIAIYGAVIGGFIGIVIFALLKKKNILAICDCVAPAAILGQAIGRWGNFINQEAFGYLVSDPKWQWFPFAVFIQDTGTWHLATFFYESMWNIIVFAVLMLLFKKVKQHGTITALYFILYGIGRLFIEGLRTDSLYVGATNIRISQVVSAILIAIGIGIILYNYFKAKRVKKLEKI